MKIATTIGELYHYDLTPADVIRNYQGTGFKYLDFSFYYAHKKESPYMQDDDRAWKQEIEDSIAGGETPEELVQAQLLGSCISTFVRQLPVQSRHVFLGRYYFLDPIKDIARYCGISEAKVKTLLYRMRCSLREYLQKEGFTV